MSCPRSRIVGICCLLGFAALLSWSARHAFGPQERDRNNWFRIDVADRDLGEVASGDTVEVEFRISNCTASPQYVLGMTEFCGLNCCYRLKDIGRVTVPAGSAISYVVLLTVHDPGPFRAEMDLYLDNNGVYPVRLAVRGTAPASGNSEQTRKPEVSRRE